MVEVVVSGVVEGVRMFLQTVGMGYLILNKITGGEHNPGEWTRDQDDHLIRMTVTGQDGRTTYVYLSRADANLVASTLLGLNA